MAFFVSAACTVALGACLVWKSGQSSVVPYLVKVNNLGEVQTSGPLGKLQPVTPERIARQLDEFVTDVRTVYSDLYAIRNTAVQAYGWLDKKSPSVTELTDWFTKNDPRERSRKESVGVYIERTSPISGTVWMVDWREDHIPKDGGAIYSDYWTVTLTIKVVPPTTDEEEKADPNGVYITGLHFSTRGK